MLSLFPADVIAQIKDHIGDQAFDALKETEQLAIVLAKTDSGLTHARLKELTKEHPKDLTDILHGLVQKGRLESTGRGRGTVYYLPGETPSLDALTPEVSADSSEQKAKVAGPVGQQPELATQSPTQSATQSTDPVIRLLSVLRQGELSAGQLRAMLRIKHRPTFRKNYIHPALEKKFIEYTIPDSPNSRLQKYRLTHKGEKKLVSFLTKH